MGFITSRNGLPYKVITEDIYVRILGVIADTSEKRLNIRTRYYWSHEARLEEKDHEEARKIYRNGRENAGLTYSDEKWEEIQQKANYIHQPLDELTFHVPFEEVENFKNVDILDYDKIVSMSYEILKANFGFQNFPIEDKY